MHILGGVDQPSEGQVVVDKTVITDLKEDKLAVFRRRQVGLIYQFYNLIPVLTVEENITLPLRLDGRKVDRDTVDQLLAAAGINQAAEFSAQPAFRRAAAAGVDRKSTDSSSGDPVSG